MTAYKKMYYRLFNRVTDALELLEKGEVQQAVALLKLAQCETEEIYREEGSEEDESEA